MLIPPLTRKYAKNRGSGNRGSDFRVSGGPPVQFLFFIFKISKLWYFYPKIRFRRAKFRSSSAGAHPRQRSPSPGQSTVSKLTNPETPRLLTRGRVRPTNNEEEKPKWVNTEVFNVTVGRECVRAGAGTRRCLGHHLLHPQILTPANSNSSAYPFASNN